MPILESFYALTYDCTMILLAELFVDWVKHAFITRFNGISAENYKDYTLYLAYELAQTKQKHVNLSPYIKKKFY